MVVVLREGLGLGLRLGEVRRRASDDGDGADGGCGNGDGGVMTKKNTVHQRSVIGQGVGRYEIQIQERLRIPLNSFSGEGEGDRCRDDIFFFCRLNTVCTTDTSNNVAKLSNTCSVHRCSA